MANKRGPKTGTRSKARPRKERNEAAAAQPEIEVIDGAEGGESDAESSAGIGDNSGEPETLEKLTDEQQRVLFVQHVVKIERLKAELDAATSDIKAAIKDAYKIAKEESCSKKDIDFALRLRKNPDDEEVEQRRREAQIAAWVNHPIGTQPDLFAGDGVDRTPSVEKAYEAGKMAGLEGAVCSPPHADNTEQGQRWLQGWHDGQANKILDGIKPLGSNSAAIADADAFEDAVEDALPIAPDEDDELSRELRRQTIQEEIESRKASLSAAASDPGEIPEFLDRRAGNSTTVVVT
jgi:ribosome modulation factor/uncharacterized protein (UPF0335 family)